MALFPRRIDSAYMMIGRQDNENLYLRARIIFSTGKTTRISRAP
ncbi:hypothetical protein GGD55_004464 [Rhizobium giardinii]|uniref:Uncharacterized protein n=1 Tax=Rhizobium giardinii TaxID=56731 RepID=A0A7W8UFC1_9HYPH|nr:hypothetical protein [Rhizobium giardinii]